MDQQNQNITPGGSGDAPLKRKRGRPRKYPRTDSEETSYSLSKMLNPVQVEQTPLPPAFNGVNGNQHLQRGQEHDSNDASVGQPVSGVVEAVFDAGYLLSVRVGDSDSTLRGLVFKPGRYVPISSENDVAPGVPMIQRSEMPIPSRPTQVQTPLPKERNEQPVNAYQIETHTMNGSPSVSQVPKVAVSSSNLAASCGKDVPYVAGQTTPQVARGNFAPVLLEPHNFANGVLVSNQPSQVITKASSAGGEIAHKEIPVEGNQALTSNAPTSQNILSSGMQSESVPHYLSSSNVVKEDNGKSLKMPGMSFDNLVTEVVERIQTPSDPMDTETNDSKSSDSVLVKDPASRQEDKVNDMDQPVLIKPLQAIQSHPQENLASAPKPSDYTETGKITELLQALQNDKTENQASKAAELGSGNKLNDTRNSGTQPEDSGTVQAILIKPLQAMQSHPQENSVSATKPCDYTETGKMTELLQVLQNDTTENQASEAAELGSGNKLDDMRDIGTQLEDGGTVQSTNPF